MKYRIANLADIPQMQVVRNSVKENTLSDPSRVTNEDYYEFLERRGRGWVCTINDTVVGFSIVDLTGQNVWALFLLPEMEGQGIGKKLHRLMLDWYFEQTQVTLWLGTSPHTRAAHFYRQAGWAEVGMHGADEIKFEMTHNDWLEKRG